MRRPAASGQWITNCTARRGGSARSSRIASSSTSVPLMNCAGPSEVKRSGASARGGSGAARGAVYCALGSTISSRPHSSRYSRASASLSVANRTRPRFTSGRNRRSQRREVARVPVRDRLARDSVRLGRAHPDQQHGATDLRSAEAPQQREPRDQLVHDHGRREHEVVALVAREVSGELAIGAPVRAPHHAQLAPGFAASRVAPIPVAGSEERMDLHGPFEVGQDARVRGHLHRDALGLVVLRDAPRIREPVPVVVHERFLDDEQALPRSGLGHYAPPPCASCSR